MRDPYDVLGVRRSDDAETIRKAFLKLAKRHHPDVNPDKSDASERFKEISAAYDLLSDTEQRARFDRGEIDATGQEAAPRHTSGGRGWAGPPPGAGARAGGRPGGTTAGAFDFEDLESLFGDAFARRAGGSSAGEDVRYSLTVDFLDAARGTVSRLALPEGRTLDVTIPAGLKDGHVLRLRGQGRPGRNGGTPGDALVEITVAAHPHFRREGDDIILRLPVSLTEAVLGAAIDVPTLRGQVRLRVPPGSQNGARLRLRGKGVGAGHQYVELAVVLPTQPEPELEAFLRSWQPAHPVDLRADLPR